MKTSRRQLVYLSGAAAAMAASSGCKNVEQMLTASSIEAPSFKPWGTTTERQLLERATFGPASYEIARLADLGYDKWLDEQLSPDTIDESIVAESRTRSLRDITDADPGLLFDEDDHVLARTLRQETLLLATYSRKQLYERMVQFWSDHFNIYFFKNSGPQYKVVDDKKTIRAHALGNFKDMLTASAQSSAMLGYLDNQVNTNGIANENYARELLELHTMGVGSGYTQHDVQQVARCFTGWTVQKHWHRGAFLFNDDAHDNGRKVVLGHVINPRGGENDGHTVIDIVASHPATAQHITKKLCLFFLGTVPEPLHSQLASTFLQTGGQIKPVVKQLLAQKNMALAKPMIKRPMEYMVSSLRSLGADTDCGKDLQSHLDSMGQQLFAWPMPDGYTLRETAWLSALAPRWRFASAICGDKIENTVVPWDSFKSDSSVSKTVGSAIFGDNSPSDLSQTLEKFGASDVKVCTYLSLISPHYQLRA
jgi:uncharacterized protein (DUF1800 family)